MVRVGILFTAACALLLCASPAHAGSDETSSSGKQDLFRRGSVELEAGAGIGATSSETYLLLLLGGNYYLLDGLSIGAAGEAWLGAQPEIGDVSPQVRYVFLDSPWRFKPYAGTFYRRTFFNHGYSPENSAGARAGLVFPLGARAYLTGGLASESFFGGANSYFTGAEVYPEIGLAFAF